MNGRLQHDVAYATMQTIMDLIVVPTNQKALLAFGIYQRIKIALEAFEERQQRETHRLNPSRN